MNILSISLDKGLFDRSSDVYWRHLQYSSLVDNYTVIVNTEKKDNVKFYQQKNLRVIPTNSHFKFLAPLNALFLSRSLKFDLVTTQDPFLTAAAALLIKAHRQVPINIQIHSEFFNSSFYRKEKLSNLLLYQFGLITLKFADTVRARNSRIAAWITKNYPRLKGKIFYVPTPLNKIFFTKLTKIKRNPNLIVTNGRLTAQKNYPLLLASFQNVLKDFPKSELHIVGVGEDIKKIQQLSKSLHISQHIKFLGWIDPVKWKRILDQAALFVLASNHEGWGLVCLEALSRETPVVMTDTGCAGEIVINNKTGLVVPVGNEQALTSAIKNILNNPKKFQKLAKTGRILVSKDSNPGFWRERASSMFQATLKSKN